MPSLALYMEPPDLELLVERIDRDGELAWIVQSSGRWIARSALDTALAPRVSLWHVPSGPLPLDLPRRDSRTGRTTGRVERKGWIDDPFSGWNDPFRGENAEPRFGNWPGVMQLHLCVRGGPGQRPGQAEVGITTLGWIGRHSAAAGQVPDAATARCYQRLARWVHQTGVRVTRKGPLEVANPGRLDVFAFPVALAAIRGGRLRAINPAGGYPQDRAAHLALGSRPAAQDR